jgi:hypothetical protein
MKTTLAKLALLFALVFGVLAPTVASADYHGNTYAVLVGISDYERGPLPRTDEDAARIARALQANIPADRLEMHLLLNGEATRDNVAQALSDISTRVTRNDHVIFFFSGHGTPVADAGIRDEADGKDEAIVLFDGNMTDDELAAALDNTKGATAMVAIDSCFSGGFLFDTTNAKGRMGFFSSDEDVTSGVPTDAGGYLSKSLAEALEGHADGVADGVSGQGRDGKLSALELEMYVRAASMPRVEASDDHGRTVGYQFIDIKRSDVSPDYVFIALSTGATPDAPVAREEHVVATFDAQALPGTTDFAQTPNFGDFELEAGTTYVIETYDLVGDTDTVLELRRSSDPRQAVESDAVVAENDDTEGLASRVEITPNETGAYYAHVRPYSAETGGTFSIRIIELR